MPARLVKRQCAHRPLLAVTRTPVLDWALRFASTRSMKSVLTWALARA